MVLKLDFKRLKTKLHIYNNTCAGYLLWMNSYKMNRENKIILEWQRIKRWHNIKLGEN